MIPEQQLCHKHWLWSRHAYERRKIIFQRHEIIRFHRSVCHMSYVSNLGLLSYGSFWIIWIWSALKWSFTCIWRSAHIFSIQKNWENLGHFISKWFKIDSSRFLLSSRFQFVTFGQKKFKCVYTGSFSCRDFQTIDDVWKLWI